MNNVILMGRLTKDTELKYSNNNAFARLTIAVDRKTKENEADFISCVAFGKTAEFINNYFRKGNRICISGRIQTGSYTDQSGNKNYTTDVVIENAEFCEAKQEQTTPPQNYQPAPPQQYQATQPQNNYYQAPPQQEYYQQTFPQQECFASYR